MSAPAYRVIAPQGARAGVVVSVPHAGRAYAPAFLARACLDSHAIRSSEDAFVDRLVQGASLAGIALLIATAPRAYVDLNRAADELDPAVIEGVPVPPRQAPRVVSGLGVIPRVVSGGRAIYHGKLTRAEAEARLAEVWHPYHRALRGMVDDTRARFGSCLLIDCHSMPSDPLLPARIILGDRYGTSAAPEQMQRVESAFADEGFATARNAPFAGAHICATYGQPRRGLHAVQVEIDRSLYMDEARLLPHEGFAPLARKLTQVFHRIAAAPALARAAE